MKFKVGDIIIAIKRNGFIDTGELCVIKEIGDFTFCISLINDPFEVPYYRSFDKYTCFEKASSLLKELA
jgi:hypothetical protein